MSIPIRKGGLGFRDLQNFNRALLAKQAWRILTNPTSLLARMYKGNYHFSLSFIDSTCGKNVSYGWRSIQAGKELLHKGLRIQLGDGKNTKVWSDSWLPTNPLRLAQGKNTFCNFDMTVDELWFPGKCEWNRDLLDSTLTREDADLAKQIILSRFAPRDTYIWPYSKDSKYYVKLGYWIATHLIPQDEEVEPPNGALDLKNAIWDLNILPKIQHFLLSGALTTNERLIKKNIVIDPICQRCCLEDETISHLLFECQHTRNLAMF